jgi:hypothetical protein
MPQRFATNQRGIDRDPQPLVNFPLADHIFHPLGTKRNIFFARGSLGLKRLGGGHGIGGG